MNFLKGRMDDIEERQARALRSKSKKVSVTNFECLPYPPPPFGLQPESFLFTISAAHEMFQFSGFRHCRKQPSRLTE